MSRRLFSTAALFNTPDEIMHAAEKVSEAGYENWDVNTPYPLHGMDHAMHLKPTNLPYVTLIMGLVGLGFAVFLQWWTNGSALQLGAHDLMLPRWVERYPFVIGGKPLFSLPAFVPVMFELTVLSAALSTIAAMLGIFCGLPHNSHPLHDTDYMKAVSCDQYGLYIESSDPNFDEAKVETLFKDLGATEVTSIYRPFEQKPGFISHVLFFGFLIATAVGVSGKAYFVYNNLLYARLVVPGYGVIKLDHIIPYNWMVNQPRLDAQEESTFFKNGRSMQNPVANTVARGYMPYKYAGNPDAANKDTHNPVPMTEENLALGKKMYEITCSMCHGDFAKGEGRLKGNLVPPSLHSSKAKKWTDARMYHVIVEGQNVMPSYAKQLDEKERWAIIHYVRALQRAMDAKESDLK
ncbi:MAG: DUF3341 domain-containing protein [Candidatus Cloacimonetes bacterium]|nr:DUF3341 domain-containing protein [Candidatus Cloacimonadota bacterium]